MKKMIRDLVLLLLAVAHVTCNQSILTAPPGSTVSVFANPTFIAANGDVSVISALVIEPAGTVVPDGTVVQFFTTLGKIQNEGKTNDGVARVNLISDTRSGTATVTVVSGGAAPAPAPSASPTATSGGAIAAGTASASVDVVIGSARPKTIILTANPPRITGSGSARQSRIVANVFDDKGNAVVNVPVIFSITESGDVTETLASGSSPVYTDSSGQAADFLQTSYSPDLPPKTVAVNATVAAAAAPLVATPVSVQIN
jgi:hypothetical protein